MNSEDQHPTKRKRALTFRTFFGTNPKTGRQKKAHARTLALVQKPDLFDAQERIHLSKPQKKRLRLKKGRVARKQLIMNNKC
jgi:hypothetical protein